MPETYGRAGSAFAPMPSRRRLYGVRADGVTAVAVFGLLSRRRLEPPSLKAQSEVALSPLGSSRRLESPDAAFTVVMPTLPGGVIRPWSCSRMVGLSHLPSNRGTYPMRYDESYVLRMSPGHTRRRIYKEG